MYIVQGEPVAEPVAPGDSVHPGGAHHLGAHAQHRHHPQRG